MKAREVIRLAAVWARLHKGTPDQLTSLKPKTIHYMLRRWRWMDLLVTFGAESEAAKLLHPRREDARDRKD